MVLENSNYFFRHLEVCPSEIANSKSTHVQSSFNFDFETKRI